MPAQQAAVAVLGGRYFGMVVPLGRLHCGTCMGCDSLRAINSSGKILPADYGPKRYREH
jgi:hypothetical protein